MGSRAERHESETETNGLVEREREREKAHWLEMVFGMGQKLPLVKWNT
jgi:hypothetical protein